MYIQIYIDTSPSLIELQRPGADAVDAVAPKSCAMRLRNALVSEAFLGAEGDSCPWDPWGLEGDRYVKIDNVYIYIYTYISYICIRIYVYMI